jgi:hypothetical protein
MLNRTQELGGEELRAACEDHVTSTWSIVNACSFLAAAMDIQDHAVGAYYISQLYKILVSIYAQSQKYLVHLNWNLIIT